MAGTERTSRDFDADRTIFVTGAAQGVGEAVARRFLADGARRFALVDRATAELERVARDLQAAGAQVVPIAAELARVDDCRASVTAAQAAFGPIDVLCSCAGLTSRGGIFDTTPQTFDDLFAVNVRAPFFIVQSALPAMIERGRGVIVNISSMLAHGGPPNLLPYSASKAALNVLTKSLANSVRRQGIRAHAINLGWTATPGEHVTQTQVHGMPQDWAAREGARQPFGRLLVPDDPAGVCAFLASADARMMTGCIIDLEQWVAGTLEVTG